MDFSFKRITSSGKFIPEIDGLRFIAISSVVIYHYWCLISIYDTHTYVDNIDYSFIKKLISHGNFGVELFFVISGFILGLPFCKYYLHNGKKVDIKSYFIRRLTRLEPPYIISLVLFALASVIFLNMTIGTMFRSFFSSLFYIHNFVYPGEKPLLNGVAWSLEVEVQFYILAPILALFFFSIKSLYKRRILLVLTICLLVLISNYYIPVFTSIYNYLHYFLLGFLLCDFYLSDSSIKYKIPNIAKLLLLVLFLSIWLYEKIYLVGYFNRIIWELYQILIIFALYYFIIVRKQITILTKPLLTNIGGMCYSIYLLHYPLIAFVSKYMFAFQFSKISIINVTIYALIYTLVIGFVSAIFYLMIEKPCMDKNWPSKIKISLKHGR
ncbi:acyltransferase family protein [Chryseobacterium sp. TY3]